MFLYIVGHKVRNNVIGANFLHFEETISQYFNHVSYDIKELQGELIQLLGTTTSSIITQD